MAYAIMRCKKIKTAGCVASSLQHCFRERETENADPVRTCENEHFAAQSCDEAMGLLRELLPEKRRKDAVLAVEYVMSASPDWWETASREQQAEFFKQSIDWLSQKYGKDNIITATVHRDEKTPHLSAFVVPVTSDGRLSAKEFIGNKSKMTNDQTSYAACLKDLNLVRGIEGSKARHQTINEFYTKIERKAQHITISEQDIQPKVIEKKFFSKKYETEKMVSERLTKTVQNAYAPAVEKAKITESERKRASEMAVTCKDIQEKSKKRELILQNLLQKAEKKTHQLMNIISMGGKRLDNLQKKIQQSLQRKTDKGYGR